MISVIEALFTFFIFYGGWDENKEKEITNNQYYQRSHHHLMMSSINDVSPVALLMTAAADSIFRLFYVPQWRDYLPSTFGLDGWFSHELPPSWFGALIKLTTYTEFVDQTNGRYSYWSFASMTKFAKMPSTSLGVVTTNDAQVVLLCLVFIVRRVKSILIPCFCSVGRKVGTATHGTDWERNNEERIVKFGEYMFRFLFHSVVSIFGLWYFWEKPWWYQAQGGIKTTFEGYPRHAIDTGMTWYYLIQCAYNVEAMLALLELSFNFGLLSLFSSCGKIQSPLKITRSPTCRGDFQEMLAHHVITNLLVIGSSHFRFTRIGSMVFMLHDISDVPVDMSKLANFMKWKIPTVVSFVTLLVTWGFTRLYILPFVIVKGVFDYNNCVFETKTSDDMHYYIIAILIFKALLIGITTLHVFWFLILIRIFYRLAMKGERHDLSEYKQGEEPLDVTKNGFPDMGEEKEVI